ncbi:MAG: Tat pathway signal protein, partial [Ignavibacteria bacterium]|nr:Tat pathway signal protein [Ignavibacteria bacterium]
MKTTVMCFLLIVWSLTSRAQDAKVQWDPFLDTLQQNTISWFLESTPDSNGLTPDRWPSPSPSSIAAVGFALTVYPIAVERGIISRDEAIDRTLHTLRYFLKLQERENAKSFTSHKGFFYHFLDMRTGKREWMCELSTIDTGLLMMGALFCQSYFDRSSPAEEEIRAHADTLYYRINWRWSMQDQDGMMMSWRPERGFNRTTWHGYNEALFLYILGLASPTYPLPYSSYEYWLSTYQWDEHYGEEYLQFTPLFGFQYSQCWIDFRGIHDAYTRAKGVDYFEISRRATYANRNYAIANPRTWRDYSENIWGLTACDGPGDTSFVVDGTRRSFRGYSARGSSKEYEDDDGTIAPTAPGASVPFAPEICIPALKAMRNKYGDALYTSYGFRDAFNPTFVTERTPNGWFDEDYLGIDQGP